MAIFAYIIIILAATLSVVNAALVSGKWFDRIFVVFFENTNYTDAIASPYFKSLVEKNNSVLMSNYFGVAHPSQPNYIASIYGDTAGITDDELYDIDGINLVDLLEAKGVSWKGYFQQY
ncbi:5506_t:CDS:2, partial [Paraglomus occultum]